MKRLQLKGRLLIGVAVLAVAVLGLGIAIPVIAHPENSSVNTYGVYLDSPTLVRLAGVLGLTPAELSSQLQTGKTLAQIAQEKNIPPTTLVEAIIAPYAEQIALQVKYGYITQEQSQALLDTARQRASYLLEQNLSASGDNGNFGHCGGYMMSDSYGPGSGWGMTGPGMMGGGYGTGYGPGMMGGWGGYYNNPTITPDSNPATAQGGTRFSTPFRNSGRGWGTMGGGMMGGW